MSNDKTRQDRDHWGQVLYARRPACGEARDADADCTHGSWAEAAIGQSRRYLGDPTDVIRPSPPPIIGSPATCHDEHARINYNLLTARCRQALPAQNYLRCEFETAGPAGVRHVSSNQQSAVSRAACKSTRARDSETEYLNACAPPTTRNPYSRLYYTAKRNQVRASILLSSRGHRSLAEQA